MSQYIARLGRRSPAAPPRLRLHRRPRRVAMLSVHTSPLHQPGTGDAGGMNVYIVELAQRLAAINIEVEIFTRSTTAALPPVVELAPGVLVRHVDAGPYEGLAKEELPAQLCAFTHGVMQAWAGHRPGHYDLVHSHYWLSGHVGWLAAQRWGVPLVHAMHTMAKVKNANLADGDTPEPAARVIGETQIVAAADRLIANTSEEAGELVHHYAADPAKVAVVHPGVNLGRFRPADGRAAARARLGLPRDALIPLFAGRIQPLKAPDVLLRAVAVLLADRPELRSRLCVPVVGGPSGSGLAKPEGLQKLAARLGIADVVHFHPPVGQRGARGLVPRRVVLACRRTASRSGLPCAVGDRLPDPGPRPGRLRARPARTPEQPTRSAGTVRRLPAGTEPCAAAHERALSRALPRSVFTGRPLRDRPRRRQPRGRPRGPHHRPGPGRPRGPRPAQRGGQGAEGGADASVRPGRRAPWPTGGTGQPDLSSGSSVWKAYCRSPAGSVTVTRDRAGVTARNPSCWSCLTRLPAASRPIPVQLPRSVCVTLTSIPWAVSTPSTSASLSSSRASLSRAGALAMAMRWWSDSLRRAHTDRKTFPRIPGCSASSAMNASAAYQRT
ncbi:D-inositol-3-phosphate glycosyltransferase [Streptomyces griseoloalbus]